MVIHPNQISANEDIILDNINRAMEHSMQYTPKELKAQILQPMWVGELMLPTPPKDKEKMSYLGLSYDLIRAVNDTDSSIEGIILDAFGIGVIKGIQSTVKGVTTLKFEKQRVTEYGLSKEVGLNYALKLPWPGSYNGRLENYPSSRVILVKRLALMEDNHNKSVDIHQALENYYKEFVIGSEMKSEDEPLGSNLESSSLKKEN
jgi:hypothetical protein